MKVHILLTVIVTQIKLNYAFHNKFVLNPFGLRDLALDVSNVDINKTCEVIGKKCIWKCCPEEQILGRFKECISKDKGPKNIHNTLANITVYDENFIRTNKSVKSIFKLVHGIMKDEIFAKNSLWWYKVHLLENGKLFLKFPNVWNRWKAVEINHYCVDLKVNGSTIIPVFMAEYPIEQFRLPSAVKKWALIVSILTLTVTLVVYCLVPQLKDMNGTILIAFLCSFIMAQIMHCCLESYNTMKLWMSEILTLTFMYYFFKVASYCWLNVIFYRQLPSRDQTKEEPESKVIQLLKYCPHTFGLPLFMTIVVIIIELSDMTDMPSFVTPQIQNRGNFSFDEIESVYYLYIPLMILLAFNWVVCFLKVVDFCKSSRNFSVVSASHAKEDIILNRPMQFVKLLTVMTLYALFEMFTAIYSVGTHYTSTTYTICIGPSIIFIFIANKEVIKLLKERINDLITNSNSNSFSMPTFFHKT